MREGCDELVLWTLPSPNLLVGNYFHPSACRSSNLAFDLGAEHSWSWFVTLSLHSPALSSPLPSP